MKHKNSIDWDASLSLSFLLTPIMLRQWFISASGELNPLHGEGDRETMLWFVVFCYGLLQFRPKMGLKCCGLALEHDLLEV